MDSKYWDTNFMRHLDVDSVQIVMEVGARYGGETLVLKNKFPNADIFSFEANPLTIEKCFLNLNGQDRIKFFPLALGEKKSKLPFYSYVKGNDGASSLFKRIDFEESQKETGSVDVITLEDFALTHSISHIDYLCMDVQGFELNVLKGAGGFLSNIKHVVMEEPNPIINTNYLHNGEHSKYLNAPSSQEIKKFMNSAGFIEIERNVENAIEDNVMYKNANEALNIL
jgi:FkbM family methyltransferase